MSERTAPTRQLIIIDSQVNDWQNLVNNVNSDNLVLILDSHSDGLTQISDYLTALSANAGAEDFVPLQSIHIISHGSAGSLLLGSSTLTGNNLSSYSSQLASIGNSLTETGDILLYGCNVAQGEIGNQFIQSLAQYTGADVAASDDLTGAFFLGGDWDLEVVSGIVEANSIQADYTHTLLSHPYTANPIASNFNFDYNDALTAALFSKAAYLHTDDPDLYSGNNISNYLTSVGWTAISSTAPTWREVDNAYAFAGKRVCSDGTVQYAISFEGSNFSLYQQADWTVSNASEYGWSNYYKNLMPLMVSVINEAMIDKIYNGKNVELTITGHSLGGAAACVAYADLFVDPNTDLWADTSNAEPLQKGMRIYDQAELDAWSDLDIQGLLTNTNVYTFGAPSFLIEPTKPNGGEWLGLGFDLAKDAIKGNGWDFFYTLGDAVADAVIVDESLLNDALKPALSQYWQHVFQFEHENTDPFTLFDPVSSIGSDDAGTVIDLNLDSSIYARYKHLGIPILFMHQMGNYAESIARLLTGADLIKTNNPLSSNTPLLNQASTTGSTGNDFLLNPTTGFGYAGNDVFVANESGSFNFNGGTGDDAYTISEYGVNLTLTGPTNERTDYLYFNLLAHV